MNQMIDTLAAARVFLLQGDLYFAPVTVRNRGSQMEWIDHTPFPFTELEAALYQNPDGDGEDQWFRRESEVEVETLEESLQEFENEFFNRLLRARELSLDGSKVASEGATATQCISFKRGWENECHIVWQNGEIVSVEKLFEYNQEVVFVD